MGAEPGVNTHRIQARRAMISLLWRSQMASRHALFVIPEPVHNDANTVCPVAWAWFRISLGTIKGVTFDSETVTGTSDLSQESDASVPVRSPSLYMSLCANGASTFTPIAVAFVS